MFVTVALRGGFTLCGLEGCRQRSVISKKLITVDWGCEKAGKSQHGDSLALTAVPCSSQAGLGACRVLVARQSIYRPDAFGA